MMNFNDKSPNWKEKIDMYLDNALSPEDQQEVQHFVSQDPNIQSVVENEKNFRDFVKNNLSSPSLSSDFVEDLKKKIRVIQP